MSEQLAQSAPEFVIHEDQTPRDRILAFFEQDHDTHFFNPLEREDATDALKQEVERNIGFGRTIVFASGVYDFLHGNHRAFLLHTKIAAMPYHWNEKVAKQPWHKLWEEMTEEQQTLETRRALKANDLQLIVSVDGNDAVAARKGNNPAKGSMPRPIYDWRTRARDIYSTRVKIGGVDGDVLHQVVNHVTIHDNQTPEFKGTPHQDIMDIAAHVDPEVWSIFYESEDIIENIQTDPRFEHTQAVVLQGHDFYRDKLLGGTFSTTRIAQRIGGVATNGVS